MDNEICEARVGSSRHPAWVLHVIRQKPALLSVCMGLRDRKEAPTESGL
jgi:hypothetical protein